MGKQLKLLILSLCFILRRSVASPHAINDGQSLLLFRRGIAVDPHGSLSNWRPDRGTCEWRGITCINGRVTQLNLSECDLSGDPAFNSLNSLHMLRVLDLSVNTLSFNLSSNLARLPRGLERIDLSASGLVGSIPVGLTMNYPNLTYLNLSHNNISGYIPNNLLGVSRNLQALDLSFNNLSGEISGVDFKGFCSELVELNLAGNRVTGVVPPLISSCVNLRNLNLSANGFIGDVPRSIGELSALERLDISGNHLSSTIPTEIGNMCDSLVELRLSGNNISGPIPGSLVSCSKLRLIDLSSNQIGGPLPADMFRNLTSLEILLLNNNFISGALPDSLSYSRHMKIAEFSSNNFTGKIPTGICPGAASLEEFRAPDNAITGEIPYQFAYCPKLKVIDLSINYLNGTIPREFGRLEDLEQLTAWFNSLRGTIPRELGQCRKLKNLILNNNLISGEIPTELLMNCNNLEWISLTSNEITGRLPRELGHLSRLAVLQLGNNSLTGEIPTELSNCASLVWLDLSSNKLTGEIPPRLGRQLGASAPSGILSGNTLAFVRNVGNSCKRVGGLLEFAGIRPERLLQVPNLKSCDFTRLYSGSALSDWTHFQTLEYLDLSDNELRGSIPEEFGDMIVLQVLDLAHNRLSGEIPPSLGRLRNLGVFDASHNALNGSIPESFSNLSFLVQVDVSSNGLTGEIPTRGQLSTLPASQFADNPGLCGVPLPPCVQFHVDVSSHIEAAVVSRSWAGVVVKGIAVVLSVASVSICMTIVWAMRRRKEAKGVRMLSSLHAPQSATTWAIEKEKEALSINVATFQRQLKKLTFSQLIEATNGFSAASLIGYGGFGEVFKATLKDGTCVAIKKLIRLSNQGDREFVAEMETLGKIKHSNLVPLLGYCKVGEERLLVYRYMKHGSLEDMLHGRKHNNESIMAWNVRKKVMLGAAKGLCFLHHNCIPHIIHRDMKSSNVLLDDAMEARVSDFGMARLISALDTHLSVSNLAGTPGYVPLEYYQSFRCTTKGDVYSFGVVMLEILTGKKPTDKEDFGDTNLVGWVRIQVKEGKIKEVIDPEILSTSDDNEITEVLRCLGIAMRCTDDAPSSRPNMLEVVSMLKELKPVEAHAR